MSSVIAGEAMATTATLSPAEPCCGSSHRHRPPRDTLCARRGCSQLQQAAELFASHKYLDDIAVDQLNSLSDRDDKLSVA